MNIQKIKWKNFNSYGNKLTELDFSQSNHSFTLLSGENGRGKSSIAEVIKYSLYGKVPNKTLKDLPNRLNKNLYVEVDLIVNQKTINIKRGIEPTLFEVNINNDPNINDKAGKNSIQEYLEEDVFGIPFYVFNNVLSISINDFKSFMKMPPKDKRGIIDKIFGFTIINQMNDILKKDIKKIRDGEYELNTKINVLTDQLNKSIRQLENLTNSLKNINTERKVELVEIIDKLNDMKIDIDNKILNLRKKERTVLDNITNIRNSQYDIKSSVKQIQEKLNLYNNSKCPCCEGDLTTDFHQDRINQFKKSIDDLKVKYREYEDIQKKYQDDLTVINEQKSKIETKINKIQVNLRVFENELKSLDIDVNLDKQTISMKKIIEDINENIETYNIQKTSNTRDQNFLKLVENILSENGVKQLAIKTVLPMLNTNINNMLKILRLDFKLIFDENFDAKITHFGSEVNVVTLSSGENKKLDLAVLISIIKLMKIKFPGINILFLDEIFSSLDMESIHEVIKILADIVKELDLHVFVVHHAPIDSTYFTQKIDIVKDNSFSQLKIENII